MDAAQAIAEMTEISPQVRHVVVTGADGAVVGSNLGSDEAAGRLAEGARELLERAEAMRPGVAQLEAATVAGSVFVVRDGERTIAATTTPEPTVGLVFYDLKTCLRSIDEPAAKPRRRASTRKPKEDAGDAPS